MKKIFNFNLFLLIFILLISCGKKEKSDAPVVVAPPISKEENKKIDSKNNGDNEIVKLINHLRSENNLLEFSYNSEVENLVSKDLKEVLKDRLVEEKKTKDTYDRLLDEKIKFYSLYEYYSMDNSSDEEFFQKLLEYPELEKVILDKKYNSLSLSKLEEEGITYRHLIFLVLPSDTLTYGDEKEVLRTLELINAFRVENNLKPLILDDEVSKVATIKSEDMIKNNYFAHESPVNGSPGDLAKKYNLKFQTLGENIAEGQETPEEVVMGWINSPGHRANILTPGYTHTGFGIVSDGKIRWTNLFISK